LKVAVPVMGAALVLVASKKASVVSPIFTVWLTCSGRKSKGRSRTLPSKRTFILRSSTFMAPTSAR
jgi:hypothetical protein